MRVYKFGGTSVADVSRMERVVDIVCKDKNEGAAIVVVSATSGTTDMLFEAISEAQCSGDFSAYADAFGERHLEMARAYSCEDELKSAVKELKRDLAYIAEGVRKQERVMARVIAQGELFSSRILAAAFLKKKIPAVRLLPQQLGMLTEGGYIGSEFKKEAYRRVRDSLKRLKRIAVVPGYIGVTADGDVTTLGRGGSDYSAAFLAAAAGANELCVYKDVSGIMSADPKIVPQAKTVPYVSYDEAAELSYFGAKVLHPKTIEPAVLASIPVRIRSSFEPEKPGTIISRKGTGRAVAAIAHRSGIDTLTLTSTRMLDAYGFLARIFEIMRHHSICVDVIATSEVSVSMTVDPSERLDAALDDLAAVARVEHKDKRAVICVVGEKMRGSPDIISRIFAASARTGNSIEMISQGASKINLTFVVKEEAAFDVIRALHKEFFEK